VARGVLMPRQERMLPLSSMASTSPAHREPRIIYPVSRGQEDWALSDETMPESIEHDRAVDLLRAILTYWARGRDALVARNFAIRWDEREPRFGVDPDVSLFSPAPPVPPGQDLKSVRTWVEGHAAPLLAVEIVSETNPNKDYVIAPEKYAASGTRELCVFDPRLAGPASRGGPHRIQVGRRDEHGDFVRCYAGDGPAYSEVLSAYFVASGEPSMMRIADDEAGARLWPTSDEAERAAKEAERAAKEAALARIAELEAALRAKRA